MQKSQHGGLVQFSDRPSALAISSHTSGPSFAIVKFFSSNNKKLSYLDEQAQVDVVGLWPSPADLAVLLVTDVDTL